MGGSARTDATWLDVPYIEPEAGAFTQSLTPAKPERSDGRIETPLGPMTLAECVWQAEAQRSAGRVEAGSEPYGNACPNCWALAQCTCVAQDSKNGAVTRDGGKIKP